MTNETIELDVSPGTGFGENIVGRLSSTALLPYVGQTITIRIIKTEKTKKVN